MNTTDPIATPVEKHLDLPEKPSISQLFEALLRAPLSVIYHLRSHHSAVAPLALIFLISSVLFGILLGSFSGNENYWLTPLKFAIGIMLSAVICFPSLYIFSCLTGADLRLPHVFRSLLASLALIGILLIGFAPLVWVFTQSSESASFAGGVTLIVWLIAFKFGTGILSNLLKLGEPTDAKPLRIWKVLFLLVTLQMSTSLRPIIGEADTDLTSEKRFFATHWIEQLVETNTSAHLEDTLR